MNDPSRARKIASEQVRKALIRSEHFTESLLNAIPVAVFYKDTEGHYIGCNRYFSETMGVSSEEIAGKTVYDLWPGEQAEIYHQRDLDLFQNPGLQIYEFEVTDKDGLVRPVVFAKDVYYDADAEPAGLVGAFIDISSRNRAEKALQTSEARYQQIFEATNVAVWEEDFSEALKMIQELKDKGVTDLRQYIKGNPDFFMQALGSIIVRDANQQAVKVAGARSKQDLLGPLSRLPAEDMHRTMKEELVAIAEGQTYFEREANILDLEGNPRTIRVSISFPSSPDNFDRVLVNTVDISESRHARIALEESEQRFRDMADMLPEAIFEANLNLTVTYANEAAYQLFGYTHDDIQGGLNGLELIAPADRDRAKQNLRRRIEGDDPGAVEYTGLRKDGTMFPVLFHAGSINSAGEISGLRGVIVDITTRKRKEEEIRLRAALTAALNTIISSAASSDHAAALFESTLDSAITALDLDGGAIWLFHDEEDHSLDELTVRNLPEEIIDHITMNPENPLPALVRDWSRMAQKNSSLSSTASLFIDSDIQATIHAPLQSGDEEIGGMLLASSRPREWKPAECGFADSVGYQIGSAVHRLSLEQALARSEKRYRIISDLSSDWATGMRIDNTGKPIPDWNTGRFEQITGFSAHELGKKNGLMGIVHPDDADSLRQHRELVLEEGSLTCEYRIIDKQGVVHWVRDNTLVEFDEKNLPARMHTAIQDITGQKEAEQAMRLSEEKYRTLVEKSLQGVVIAMNNPVRLIFASQPMQDITGFEPDELTAMNPQQLAELIHTDYREEFFGNFALRLAGKKIPPQHEYRVVHKNGEDRWVEIFSTRIEYEGKEAVQTAFIDITERKEMEMKLRETNDTLHALIQSSPSAIVALDLQGRVTLWNPAAEEIFGFTEEEVLGAANPIVPDNEIGFFRKHLELQQQGSTYKMELKRRTKSGELIDVSLSTAPLSDADGSVIGFIGVFEDVTEHKRAEAERTRLEEEYRQAQRVEAVGRLAGGVAHDLNNLLTPILLHAEMLVNDFEEGLDSTQSAREILAAGNRAKDLVRQLLAFSRKQNLEYKPVQINAIIKSFGALLKRTIREDIRIDFKLKPMKHTIFADVGQIEQVIMNLAVNAQDAMPHGGDLVIKTDLIQLDQETADTIPDLDPGEHVVLSIRDTGIGMDEETRLRIFEPFYSTKGKKGTGLGLSTVYGILKQHSGHIHVKSEPGKGTVFDIYFPAVTGITPEAPGKQPDIQDLSGDETILLVEDNKQVRDLTLAILRKSGYRVLAAENGAEGLRVLNEYDQKIHLLLTDVVMPEMNGRQLYRQASAVQPDLKVLYMSGYSDDVIAQSGVLQPGVLYLQKPYTIQALKAKIREALSSTPSKSL